MQENRFEKLWINAKNAAQNSTLIARFTITN